MFSEFIHWFCFSVIISLFHIIFAIILLIFYEKKDYSLILKDSGLMFFAMSLTASSFGDFLINVNFDQNLLLKTTTYSSSIFIILITSLVYSNVLKEAVIGGRARKISTQNIAVFSCIMVLIAIIYGSSLFFLKFYFENKPLC